VQDVSRRKERKAHPAGEAVVPGLIKSDNPKSVALRGESSFEDLKRKFWKKMEDSHHSVNFVINEPDIVCI
jgi:hypothetical protein